MSPRSSLFVSLVCCLALFGTAASAQSLKERKAIKAAEKRFKEGSFISAEEHCGVKLPPSVNWKSFSGHYTGNHSHAVAANFCTTIADGLRWTCDNDDGKAAVKKQIKSVECVWDEGATKEKLGRRGPSLKLKKGKLTAGYNFETSNISDETKAWLERELRGEKKYSLRDTVEIKKAEKYFETTRNFTMSEAQCGVKFTYKIDWSSALPELEGNKSHASVASYCGSVFDGVWAVCSDEDGKAAVAESIKSIECRFDKSITKKKLGRYGPKLKLKKGKLTATYGWETANMQDGTKEWLLNNL